MTFERVSIKPQHNDSPNTHIIQHTHKTQNKTQNKTYKTHNTLFLSCTLGMMYAAAYATASMVGTIGATIFDALWACTLRYPTCACACAFVLVVGASMYPLTWSTPYDYWRSMRGRALMLKSSVQSRIRRVYEKMKTILGYALILYGTHRLVGPNAFIGTLSIYVGAQLLVHNSVTTLRASVPAASHLQTAVHVLLEKGQRTVSEHLTGLANTLYERATCTYKSE